jgi:cytoskeletal protein RodZ
MSNQFSPEEDDRMPEKKSSQQLLLLLLLLLIVLFAYLYFFTSVIRPRENPPPPPPPVAEVMVKKPLPPRLGEKGAETAKPETKSGKAAKEGAATAPSKEAKPASAAPAAKATPAAKPGAAAPEAKPAKPAPAPAAQAKGAKAAAPAVSAQQAKSAKPETAANGAKTAPAAEKKTAAVPEKKTAAKPAAQAKVEHKQGAGEAVAKQNKPQTAAKPAASYYTLELNGDLLESEMAPVTAKLKGAGIVHLVKTKVNKGEPMHRLYLADFGNHDEAQEELDRLKLVAPHAFMLNENGRYAVYAGSYLREDKAAVEQNRLLAKGVKLLVKSATAPVMVVKVRAGSFADRASAEKAVKSLKKGGLSAKVVKVAR